MTLQYENFLTLSLLFKSNPFIPEFNILEDDDIIYLDFEIQYSMYTVIIFNDGKIQCSIKNSQMNESLNNCELDTFFNVISQSNVTFGTQRINKLWRYLAPNCN